jgi:hypothetical protein
MVAGDTVIVNECDEEGTNAEDRREPHLGHDPVETDELERTIVNDAWHEDHAWSSWSVWRGQRREPLVMPPLKPHGETRLRILACEEDHSRCGDEASTPIL